MRLKKLRFIRRKVQRQKKNIFVKRLRFIKKKDTKKGNIKTKTKRDEIKKN